MCVCVCVNPRVLHGRGRRRADTCRASSRWLACVLHARCVLNMCLQQSQCQKTHMRRKGVTWCACEYVCAFMCASQTVKTCLKTGYRFQATAGGLLRQHTESSGRMLTHTHTDAHTKRYTHARARTNTSSTACLTGLMFATHVHACMCLCAHACVITCAGVCVFVPMCAVQARYPRLS